MSQHSQTAMFKFQQHLTARRKKILSPRTGITGNASSLFRALFLREKMSQTDYFSLAKVFCNPLENTFKVKMYNPI